MDEACNCNPLETVTKIMAAKRVRFDPGLASLIADLYVPVRGHTSTDERDDVRNSILFDW